jgi:ScaI restriction endonuclease
MTQPIQSPYTGLAPSEWEAKTKLLIAAHPLPMSVLRKAVLDGWEDIFSSSIGSTNAKIGHDIFLVPQAMATLLQELVALRLQHQFPQDWRRDRAKNEKDLVYLPNDYFSIEVKTSSSANDIFGNRSYAQPATLGSKSKSGYYLAINFDAFGYDKTNDDYYSISIHPVSIKRVRFGWLDHSDWLAQMAATGQQARLTPDSKKYKLLLI